MRGICVSLLFASALLAQPPGAALNVQTPAPASPSVVLGVSGAQGQASYNYWVIANFVSGSTVSSPAIITYAPNTLSGSNFVVIGWNAIAGASTYDVVRLTAPNLYNGTSCLSCAVATGLTALSATDTGAGLSSYTQNPTVGVANGSLYINNTNFTPPQFRQIVNGVDNPVISYSPPVTLTAAQINGMYAAPVLIIPAQGTGSLIRIDNCIVDAVYGSAAFTGGGTVQFFYGSASPPSIAASATIPVTFLTTFSSNQLVGANGINSGVYPSSNLLNTAVYLSNNSGAFSLGTGAKLIVSCQYYVVGGLQ